MNVLVIGCGMLGRKIAQTLDRMGWDVSAMDARESELELLSESFGGVTFRGYPMDLRDLRQAGIESCDAVAVTTADDNLNIAVAQIPTPRASRFLKISGCAQSARPIWRAIRSSTC